MPAGVPWRPASRRPRLLDGEVHVYCADLTARGPHAQAMGALLDEDERARAGRFAFEGDRLRFVAAHAILREVLARYLPAAELRFTYGPHGKPALARGEGLEFNMSHSGDLALYAVTRGRAVGVDVERVRPEVARELTAARFFTPAEVEGILSLPDAAQTRAFFTVWTRKEACLKATGRGLSVPLDAFAVWPAAGPPWQVLDLDVGPGYAAALAAEGAGWTLRRWTWTGL